MPVVQFERTGFSVNAPEGGRVADLCDAQPRAGIPYSCRHANCGLCRVDVLEGAERCAPASAAERSLLEHLASPPERRLACQLSITPGPGLVRLRACG